MRVGPEKLFADVRPWRVGLWLLGHVALMAYFTALYRGSPEILALWYPAGVGGLQALLLWPLLPDQRRKLVVTVASCGAVLALSLPMVAPGGGLLTGFLAMVVSYAIWPGAYSPISLAMGTTPVLGGIIAGLAQWWIFRRYVRHAQALITTHALLALLPTLIIVVFASHTLGRTGPQYTLERAAWAGLSGLVIAVVSGIVLRRPELRPSDEVALSLQDDAQTQTALPATLLIERHTVAAWLGWTVLLGVALVVFLPGFPSGIFFLAFGYGPTFGVLQAWLIHTVITGGQRTGVDSTLGWLLPPVLFSPAAGFAVAAPVAALIFDTCGKTPNCTFGANLVYLPGLAAGLALGLMQWWQLRRWVRPQFGGLVLVVVQTAAPLLLALTALYTVAHLLGELQDRSWVWPQRLNLATVAAVAAGSLTMALVTGAVLWLLVRPRSAADPDSAAS